MPTGSKIFFWKTVTREVEEKGLKLDEQTQYYPNAWPRNILQA